MICIESFGIQCGCDSRALPTDDGNRENRRTLCRLVGLRDSLWLVPRCVRSPAGQNARVTSNSTGPPLCFESAGWSNCERCRRNLSGCADSENVPAGRTASVVANTGYFATPRLLPDSAHALGVPAGQPSFLFPSARISATLPYAVM